MTEMREWWANVYAHENGVAYPGTPARRDADVKCAPASTAAFRTRAMPASTSASSPRALRSGMRARRTGGRGKPAQKSAAGSCATVRISPNGLPHDRRPVAAEVVERLIAKGRLVPREASGQGFELAEDAR